MSGRLAAGSQAKSILPIYFPWPTQCFSEKKTRTSVSCMHLQIGRVPLKKSLDFHFLTVTAKVSASLPQCAPGAALQCLICAQAGCGPILSRCSTCPSTREAEAAGAVSLFLARAFWAASVGWTPALRATSPAGPPLTAAPPTRGVDLPGVRGGHAGCWSLAGLVVSGVPLPPSLLPSPNLLRSPEPLGVPAGL